jgi:penicillin-binding protein-related factor A, putative recombinase
MCLELKSVKGKSISFERTKDDKGIIHYHQIQGLLEVSKYEDILAGFIINFREIETTYFIEISEFCKMIGNLSKKSFNINDLEEYKYVLIPSQKKRTRYKYDMESFIENFKFKE